MNAKHRTLLLLAGCCFVAGGLCVLAGCSDFDPLAAISRAFGGGNAVTKPPNGSGIGEQYSIASLFWTWARILIGLGIVGCIASIFLPIIPTRACASVAVAGVACAIIAKFFAAYGWLIYTAFGVGAIVCLWPFVEALRRWVVAEASQQPIKGHTGTAALAQLNPFRKASNVNARKGADPRGDRPDGVVRLPETRPETGGSD